MMLTPPRRSGSRIRWALIAAVFLPAAALAQLTNDEVPRQRTVPVREEIDAQMQGSRYHLGPFRLSPSIIFGGPTYDNNVFGASGDEPKFSDWTATVSAGTGVLVPIGRWAYLRGSLFPQYIWYDRLEERRQWGGNYSGGLYLFSNRISFLGTYSSTKTPTYPNDEILTEVLGVSENALGRLEVALTGALSLFAAAQYQRLEYRPLGDAPIEVIGDLADLNRKEGAVRGGVRYKINSYCDVGVGAEATRTEFLVDPENGDNESKAALAAFYYSRPRLFVNLRGGYREGRAINGSTFPAYDTFTGSGYITYELLRPLDVSLYGHRVVSYALVQDNPYYFDNVGGLGLNIRLGYRVTLRGFGELGENVYPVPVPQTDGPAVKRTDKLTAYGGGLSVLILRSLSVTALASNTEYDSNLPEFDRSVFRFTAGLVLGAIVP
jgi:hypothetical protein